MTIPASGSSTANRMRTMPLGFGGGLGYGSGDVGAPSDALLLCLALLALLSLGYAFFILRPRTKGGKRGPPIVTSSPVCGIPVIGTIVEFGKSPVKMVQRCYEDYGPVFTVPVSRGSSMATMTMAMRRCIPVDKYLLPPLLLPLHGCAHSTPLLFSIIDAISHRTCTPSLCLPTTESFSKFNRQLKLRYLLFIFHNDTTILTRRAYSFIIHVSPMNIHTYGSSSTSGSPSSSVPRLRNHSSKPPTRSSPKTKSTAS